MSELGVRVECAVLMEGTDEQHDRGALEISLCVCGV